ncbi:UNVERIFIED_CONTAM: hypothetical protein FKN15_004683 [Acipenser sinensis]
MDRTPWKVKKEPVEGAIGAGCKSGLLSGRQRTSGKSREHPGGIKIQGFVGTSSWKVFAVQLELLAKLHYWSEVDKASQLTRALRDDAQLVLLCPPPDSLRQYMALSEASGAWRAEPQLSYCLAGHPMLQRIPQGLSTQGACSNNLGAGSSDSPLPMTSTPPAGSDSQQPARVSPADSLQPLSMVEGTPAVSLFVGHNTTDVRLASSGTLLLLEDEEN